MFYVSRKRKCGYCPTAGIGMVAKPDGSVSGKFIPKYADDTCAAPVGLLKADKCAQWLRIILVRFINEYDYEQELVLENYGKIQRLYNNR